MKITLSPEVVREGLNLLRQRDEQSNGKSKSDELDLAAVFEAISSDVPEEAWAKVPADLSATLDSYLYGSPKKS